MKKKTLTVMIFVLLASLVFAKDNGNLFSNEELFNMQELSKDIETQIQQNLPKTDICDNWLREDPLGYLSMAELKDVSDMLIDILASGKANLKDISDRTQFDIMSYVIDMHNKDIFKQVMEMGFNHNKVNLGLREANIFSQIVLSENKYALDYLYIILPYDVLEKEMYEGLYSLINQNCCDVYGKSYYKKISAKYAVRPADFEDLKQAVLSGKVEGAAELEIAYNSIPKNERVKELYSTLLSLIYYRKNNVVKEQ